MRTAIATLRTDTANIRVVTDWLDTPEALNLRQATDSIRSGCVVLICSYFETFLKDVIKSFIHDVNRLGRKFEDLPGKMQHAHFERGGACLEKASRQDRKNGNTALCNDLATRLHSVTRGGAYTLVWEAFADTRSSPRSEVISELLKRFEIRDPWTSIDAKSGGKGEILKLFLDTFIETRNVCAHTGSNAQPPSSQDIRQDVDSLLLLAQSVVEVLEDRLAQL